MEFRCNRSKRLALFGVLCTLAACGKDGMGPDSGRLQISPDTLTIEPRQSQQFSVLNPQQKVAGPAGPVTWITTGGSITPQGLFTADTSVREYTITVRDGTGNVANAIVHTQKKLQQLIVAPGTAAVGIGGTLQFLAYGLTRSGDSLAASVSYSATGGNITAGGLYTAGSTLGTYRVIGRNGSLADTSLVTVSATAPPPGPATIEITPTTATIDKNAAYQFRATVRDAAGTVLTGQTVTWSSANSGIASVDGSGLARGMAAGSTTLTASSGGKSGTAAVTVQLPASECNSPRPEWIWCDDFEQDRLSSYFEYDAAGGNFTRTNGSGLGGTTGMTAHWGTGQLSAGSLHLGIGKVPSSSFRPVDGGTAVYREVYWRMYVKNQAGWTGGGGDKLSRAIVFAGSNWAEAAIAHVWSGPNGTADANYLALDPARGTDAAGNLLTTGYNDFAHLTWLGQARGTTPLFDASHVGQWYCVEAHARLNSGGSSDGMFELWVNGSLETQKTGLNFLGSFSAYGINAVYFENYWNAGSPKTQERYLDNLVVSTSRIGC